MMTERASQYSRGIGRMDVKRATEDEAERTQLPLFEESGKQTRADVSDYVTVDDVVVQGLAHLNERTERTGPAKFTSPRPMKARVEDGAALEDICLVIDFCHAMWWKDPKMEQFIRPKTLFGKENFPDYLVRARKWAEEGRKPLGGKHQREHGSQRSVEAYSAHVRGGKT